ncbi:MAG: V-type ATP synthase subunit I [Candidatus Anstonellaceae archaeon]
MFRAAKMQKIKMIGLLQDLYPALALWRRLGIIQLEYTPYKQLGINKGYTLEVYQELSEQLLKLRTAKNYLIPRPIEPKALEKNPLQEAKEININDELLEIETSLKELSKEQENLKKQILFYSRLEGFEINFSSLPKSLNYYLLSVSNIKIKELKERLSAISSNYSFLLTEDKAIKNNLLVLIAIEKGKDLTPLENIATFLEIPNISSSPKQAKLSLELKAVEVDDKIKSLLYRKLILSEKYYATIVRLEEALNLEAELAREVLKFGTSKSCFFATGWIKEAEFEKFKNTTLKFLEGRIAISIIPPSLHHYQNCPTLLENPSIIKPFEDVLKFLYVPNAKEIDPSALIFLTIPLNYALIVADAGYAMLSAILSLFVLLISSKGSLLEALGKIWLIGAIPTLFFGILFDEYFGFTHKDLLGQKLYTPILHRTHSVQLLLLYSIIVGWILMILGFILGAINSWQHSKKHAAAKLCWVVIQIGFTITIASFLGESFTQYLLYGVGIFIIGIVGLIFFEGPLGIVEVPGLISNIMSFSRITAVGVAGLILAEAINQFLFPKAVGAFSIEGAISFVLMFLLYTLFHFVNTFIAMFEGFLHSARLSFLEFFTKFFEGGGKLFSPFTLSRKYTLDKIEFDSDINTKSSLKS